MTRHKCGELVKSGISKIFVEVCVLTAKVLKTLKAKYNVNTIFSGLAVFTRKTITYIGRSTLYANMGADQDGRYASRV